MTTTQPGTYQSEAQRAACEARSLQSELAWAPRYSLKETIKSVLSPDRQIA